MALTVVPETTVREQAQDLGDLLFRTRKSRHLSQRDAAAQIGISFMTYRLWEKNAARPSMEYLARAALWLGTSAHTLLRLAGTASAEQNRQLQEHALNEYWDLATCWPQRFQDRARQQIERRVRVLHNPATDGWRYLLALAEGLSTAPS